MNERTKLVAPCGIDCAICEMYTCKDNPQMLEYFISKGYSREALPCKGCIAVKGKCPVMNSDCETYSCVQSKNITTCSSCNDFPCDKLAPSADMANILPHNLKLFNLLTIKRIGVEEFTHVSLKIKETYYRGKMIIGAGPRIKE
jgi:hypothetical protein